MAKSGEISAASSFMILAGSISGPVALLGFSFCNNFRTPSAVTLMSGIAGYVVYFRCWDVVAVLSSPC